jgi:hypothetical protein
MTDRTADDITETTTIFSNGLKTFIRQIIGLFGGAFSELFCIKSPILGMLLIFGISFNIRYTLFAFTGIILADAAAAIFSLRAEEKLEKVFHINGLLTAVACAWLLDDPYVSVLIQTIITFGALSTALITTAALLVIFENSKLPILGWGYSLTVGFMFQLFPGWSHNGGGHLLNWPYPTNAMEWLYSFLRSLGVLLYQPVPEVGLVIAITILLWSRIMFIFGLVSWLSGISVGLFLSYLHVNYFWLLSAHNYFLAGMMLSSVFYSPGRYSILIAIFSGFYCSLITAIIHNIIPGSAWAYLPISSALTIWIGLKALYFSQLKYLIRFNTIPNIPPEYSWLLSERWIRIFGYDEPLLIIPVRQPVSITQSFSGGLSHRGFWRHALDLQHIPINLRGETNASLWDTAVYSPAFGIIEKCRDDIPDNPLGVSNFANNWGNYVILRLDVGGWVLLAHLKQGSLSVRAGSAVNTGDYIGKVGNSGRSPFPHLHMQAQVGPFPGSKTKPFRLANYINGGEERGPLVHWVGAGIPELGNEIIAAASNPAVFSLITRFAPGSGIWEFQCNGIVPPPFNKFKNGSLLTITIEIDDYGRHIIKSSAGGTIIANMDPDAFRIYEVNKLSCPILCLISFAISTVPYCLSLNMHWSEPSFLIKNSKFHWLELLIAPYIKKPFIFITSLCTKLPDPDGRGLEIKSSLDLPLKSLPSTVTSRLSSIRGPEFFKATFLSGEVSCTLISFEPKYPSQGIKPISIVSESINSKDLNAVRYQQDHSEGNIIHE